MNRYNLMAMSTCTSSIFLILYKKYIWWLIWKIKTNKDRAFGEPSVPTLRTSKNSHSIEFYAVIGWECLSHTCSSSLANPFGYIALMMLMIKCLTKIKILKTPMKWWKKFLFAVVFCFFQTLLDFHIIFLFFANLN